MFVCLSAVLSSTSFMPAAGSLLVVDPSLGVQSTKCRFTGCSSSSRVVSSVAECAKLFLRSSFMQSPTASVLPLVAASLLSSASFSAASRISLIFAGSLICLMDSATSRSFGVRYCIPMFMNLMLSCTPHVVSSCPYASTNMRESASACMFRMPAR